MRSLAAGAILPIVDPGPTICDALQTMKTVPLTFDILSERGATGVAVTDAEAASAVAFAFRHLKLVVEPGGAVALAAALTGRVDLTGKTAVIVLSGGNVDPRGIRGVPQRRLNRRIIRCSAASPATCSSTA